MNLFFANFAGGLLCNFQRGLNVTGENYTNNNGDNDPKKLFHCVLIL